MKQDKILKFNDEEIASLFGNEAAEDEKTARLREYYFKNEAYEQIVADLPLRIVVGHKGIGKSALFKYAQLEFKNKDIITISLTPDDIIDLEDNNADFLKQIKSWKSGLSEIITNKVLSQFIDKKNITHGSVDTIISIVSKILKQKSEIDINDEKRVLLNNFIQTQRIVVFIDDLDRGWEGKNEDIRRISALLNAVRDLARENESINFKISLRTDVYYQYRTSDESTDKVEGSVVWLSWNNYTILALLVKRIITYFGENISEKELLSKKQKDFVPYLNYVFEERFFGKGNWENIPIYRLLTSLIRKRPRDLIKLCTLAAKEARKKQHSKIGTDDFNSIFDTYSQGRLRDTVIEFRSELPDIERLLTNMKPTKFEKKTMDSYQFTRGELLQKVKNIIARGEFRFSNGKIASAEDLCAFMYKINFLTGRKKNEDKIDRKYFEESNFLMNKFADFGYDWEIHPAYRWALQPDNLMDIINTLSIYSE